MDRKVKGTRVIKKISAVACILVLLLVIISVVYIEDYYKAIDPDYAVEHGIEKREYKGYVTYGDIEHADTALIFYPGGKVQKEAYEPIITQVVKRGIPCVLADMPGRLAILDIKRADSIKESFNNIDNWYIAGHSLGGATAAMYTSEHQDEFKGLILLAAYSTRQLGDELPVLLVYGSDDNVMNIEKYKENKVNLENYEEFVIDGANHCGFGYYGMQKGDHEAHISQEEQWDISAEKIVDMVQNSSR